MESFSCKWLLLSFLLISCASFGLGAVDGVKGGKVRGVNLGNWLVVERWMKPSLFDGIDNTGKLHGEYQLCNGLGPEKAKEVLTEHRTNYVTREDFQFLSQNTINTVRIPVGWWIAQDPNPPAPYVGGSLAALDNAFTWAKEFGLKCIIDLHAAPGSQNGESHSSTPDGSIQWTKPENVKQSLDVIEFLAFRYGSHPALLGIELLNEPHAPDVSPDILKKYYKDGYDIVRKHSATAYVIMCQRIGYPSNPKGLYNAIANMGLSNVVFDLHYYNLFYDPLFKNMSPQQNIDYIRINRTSDIEHISTANGPLLFIGEWVNEWEFKGGTQKDYQNFGRAQLDAYGSTSFGWAYWSLRNGDKNMLKWSLKWNIKYNYLQL